MAKNKHSIKKIVKDNYRLTPIKEIAVRNELPLSEVREAYRKCRYAVLKETVQNIKHGKINFNYFQIMDRIFSLTEEYLDTKRLKEIDEQERLSKLSEFSTENGFSYSNVKGIYSNFNSRLSFDFQGNKLEEALHYKPELGKKAFDLTKRYFDIKSQSKFNLK